MCYIAGASRICARPCNEQKISKSVLLLPILGTFVGNDPPVAKQVKLGFFIVKFEAKRIDKCGVCYYFVLNKKNRI